MNTDREEKKMTKDYIKSISKISTRHIFQWTAGELKEYDFDRYQLESVFPDYTFNHALIVKSPTLTIWYVKRGIKLGKIFLRLKVREPSKPPRFRENGWVIRNQSTREDKTAFGRNISFFSIKQKNKWKFWET